MPRKTKTKTLSDAARDSYDKAVIFTFDGVEHLIPGEIIQECEDAAARRKQSLEDYLLDLVAEAQKKIKAMKRKKRSKPPTITAPGARIPRVASIDIPEETIRKLWDLAADQDMTLDEYVLRLIAKDLRQKPTKRQFVS